MISNMTRSKNALFSGVSLTSLCLALPAGAAEWELQLGGYAETYLAFASYDSATSGDFDGADAVGSSEIFILPSVTLDNGLQYSFNLELEGHVGESNAGAEVDEASLIVSGSFGQILIGKSDTPGNQMAYGAPESVGPAVNFSGVSSNALASFIPFENVHGNRQVGDDVFRGTLGSTFVSNSGEETHGRITYFTPRFAGFQLGVSYAHDKVDTGITNLGSREKFFDIGANYVNSFGDFDVAASARWGIAENSTDSGADPEYYGLGVNLGFGGVTIGGSWAESNNSSNEVSDGHAFDLGASYATGPWTFSFNYLNGRNVDDEHAGFGPRERFEALTLATRYHIAGPTGRPKRPAPPGSIAGGPGSLQGRYDSNYDTQQGVGVYAIGFLSYVNFDEDVGDGGFGTQGDDIEGFVIGTGIKLTF